MLRPPEELQRFRDINVASRDELNVTLDKVIDTLITINGSVRDVSAFAKAVGENFVHMNEHEVPRHKRMVTTEFGLVRHEMNAAVSGLHEHQQLQDAHIIQLEQNAEQQVKRMDEMAIKMATKMAAEVGTGPANGPCHCPHVDQLIQQVIVVVLSSPPNRWAWCRARSRLSAFTQSPSFSGKSQVDVVGVGAAVRGVV